MSVVVRPLWFTDRLGSARDELVTLGLRPRQAAAAGGWLDLAGAGGLVALHSVSGADEPVAQGETWLSFEADDADDVAARLRSAGIDGVVADEAYGREVRVTTPDGLLRIGETKHDAYGFVDHPTAAGAAVVVATIATASPEHWVALLGALGLEPAADGVSFGSDRTGEVRLAAGATRASRNVTATVELRAVGG